MAGLRPQPVVPRMQGHPVLQQAALVLAPVVAASATLTSTSSASEVVVASFRRPQQLGQQHPAPLAEQAVGPVCVQSLLVSNILLLLSSNVRPDPNDSH
jgi:hypothetical protein